MKLDYGVYPFHAELTDDRDDMKAQALEIALESGMVKKGDVVIMICGSLTGGQSSSDTMIIANA